jgi:hypothetical protein
MLKEYTVIKTVGELKQWIADVPDNTPIGRLTEGYYQINKIGDVAFYVDKVGVSVTGEIDDKETPMVILRISD